MYLQHTPCDSYTSLALQACCRPWRGPLESFSHCTDRESESVLTTWHQGPDPGFQARKASSPSQTDHLKRNLCLETCFWVICSSKSRVAFLTLFLGRHRLLCSPICCFRPQEYAKNDRNATHLPACVMSERPGPLGAMVLLGSRWGHAPCPGESLGGGVAWNLEVGGRKSSLRPLSRASERGCCRAAKAGHLNCVGPAP